MNSLERVMGVVTGQPVDRPPVFAVLGAYAARSSGVPLRALYEDAAAHVRGQLALREAFGFDLVIAPFDFSAIGEAFGGQTAWFEHQAPNLRRPAVGTAAEALALTWPSPAAEMGRLQVCPRAAEALAAACGSETPVFGILPGPGGFPALIMGMESWVDTLLFDQARARELLARSVEWLAGWAARLVAAGVTALIMPEPAACSDVLPRGLFLDTLEAPLLSLLPRLGAPVVVHHTGGRVTHLLDRLATWPILGVAVGARDDLVEARELLGPGKLLVGNLDNLAFPGWSPEQVAVEARARLEQAFGAGPFILSSSGGDIPLSTPPDTLRALVAACAGFGSPA